MDKKILFILAMLFCFVFANAVTITSTGTGNWNSPSSWVGGVVPTVNDDVIITTGSTITINSNVSAKSITINGTLLTGGDRTVTTSAGNTLKVVINGTLGFATNQSDIRFPDGTVLVINTPGKIDNSGGCSNNVAIYIGSVKFAVCVGSGNAQYTFDQLNDLGGTLQSDPGSNTPVCGGSTLTFTAAKKGADGSALSWQWSIKPPGSLVFTTYPVNQSTVSFANAIAGSYEANLTYNTTYGGSSYTNSKTIFATVNSKPATPAITANGATTFCTGGSVTLTSNVGTSYLWSTGATTQSIAVTTSGNYSVQITNASGCQSLVSTATTITVNPKPSAPTITTSGPTALCQGDNVTLTSSSGSSYLWSTGATTQSILVNTSGSYSVQITNASGCQSLSSSSTTVTMKSLLALPTVAKIVQPTCITPTGSVLLTGLPNTTSTVPNWTIKQSGPAIKSYIGGSDPDPTTFTILNLVPGVYNFTIEFGDSCPVAINNVEIKAPITNIWDGLVWSKGSDPINTDSIEFAADYQSTGDLSGCSCKVDSGKSVTINSGHTLTIDNALNIESATGASLTFENNASLLQVNDAVNVGNIAYKRNTSPVRRYDFTFWSSPITRNPAFTLYDLSPNTLGDKYYRYNAITDSWVIIYNGAAPMVAGVGYIIRGPQNSDINIPAVFKGTFVGVPNNGPVSVSLGAAEKWNLIGNPYPSAVYADQFIFDNSANIYGTLYFWTHNSLPSDAVLGDAKYNYTTDDYAPYNLTGSVSVGTLSGNGATTSGNQSAPLGYIAAGQSFFLKSKTGSNVVFTNSMRKAGHDGQFFKTSNSNTVEKSRIWLNLTNSQGAFKQILIGYIQGATNKMDSNYDGPTLDGNKYVDFYSINETKDLVVQGRALPFDEADLVPLGYRSAIAGDFTIAIDHADGNLSAHAIYLEDKVTGIIHDLRLSNYVFTTAIGTFPDRFVLRYTDKTLGTVDFENLDNNIFVSVKDKNIKITSTKEVLKDVVLYDISARMIYNKKKIGSTELQIPNLQSGNQVLLVKVTLENGYSTSRKIIF